jgi:hypothetical protein
MHKDTSHSLSFSSVSNKKVEAAFDGGEITTDAGVLLLRETELRMGIINELSHCIIDRRDQRYVKHSIQDMLNQRIYQIALGYEDANDCNALRSDPAFKLALERLPVSGENLASQPTISRFENSVCRKELFTIANVLVGGFINSYANPPTLIVLDFDDTEDETHGDQELTSFNGYYNSHCYLPLHIYEGISGKLISTILKPGKRATGKQIVSILKRLVKKIRSSWPDTTILFRGDSHFCSPEVLRFCKKHGLLYCIGLAGNSALQRMAQELKAEAQAVFAVAKRKVRLYDSFTYQAETWDEPLDVVVKVEVTDKGCNLRFVVNNLDDTKPTIIYQDVYCGRGQTENHIKNHKVDLKSDRTSCHSFAANQLRLFLHSAAYNLLHSLRENTLKATEFANAQFSSIRLYLLKIGAMVQELKSKVKLHLPSSFPLKPIFTKACDIFCSVPPTEPVHDAPLNLRQ